MNKKMITFVRISILCLFFTNTAHAQTIIATSDEFYEFAQSVNEGSLHEEQIVQLGNDIHLNDTTGWRQWAGETKRLRRWFPIGTQEHPFKGVFDGKGHRVYGLYISTSIESFYQGLFGYVQQASILNVGLECSYIKAYNYIGGIAGYISEGTLISNCYQTGMVAGDRNCIGGIIGFSDGINRIIDCYNGGIVSGKRCTGGIIGYFQDGSVYNCSNTGKVTGLYEHTGGIIGEYSEQAYKKKIPGRKGIPNDTLANCYNTGTVQGRDIVGGLIGRLHLYDFMHASQKAIIANCYSTGKLVSRFPIVTDGLVGCYTFGRTNVNIGLRSNYTLLDSTLIPNNRTNKDLLTAESVNIDVISTIRRIEKEGAPCYWSRLSCKVDKLSFPRFSSESIEREHWLDFTRDQHVIPKNFYKVSEEYMQSSDFLKQLNDWVDKNKGKYKHWKVSINGSNSDYPVLE